MILTCGYVEQCYGLQRTTRACQSCFKPFKNSKGLESHIRQSKNCKWVLEQRAAFLPAPIPDFRPTSTTEAAPYPQSPRREVDPSNDIFSTFDIDGELSDPDSHDEQPPSIHDSARRATVEDALDDDDIIYAETLSGAGAILGTDGTVHDAYKKLKTHSSGDAAFFPFKNRVDHEIALWGLEETGSNAFSKLLAIEGVRCISFHLYP